MSESPVVLWSRPESERAGTPLLVMFHGYGADEADLFGLAAQLPAEFTVASIRAPLQAGPGRAWFPLRNDLSYTPDSVTEAAAEVEAWLDTVRGGHTSVTLFGFSQGMCMATTLLRHRPADYAAVVGLSGFVVEADGDPWFDDAATAAAKPEIFWGRDQADPVVPAAAVEYTNTWLRAHTKLTKVLYTGILHGINAQEMAHVGEFLTLKVLKP
ncbi:phospholipase [Arthrobacter livingstonensis]|uniref:Phospholipase n=1 Tax=Arthrobacter livingstonensis TaxID=670078 RepID=A0A2V5LTZ0_9MICC|nr:phospholipase [Arthrobacter livingstonensis]PYI66757.1 phospholipase [Arthrobacter livingstonensis]